jgi:hypothetical protein
MMRTQARVILVDGISKVPGVTDALDQENDQAEARRQKRELLLLNVATGLSIMLVSCAWIAIALD